MPSKWSDDLNDVVSLVIELVLLEQLWPTQTLLNMSYLALRFKKKIL